LAASPKSAASGTRASIVSEPAAWPEPVVAPALASAAEIEIRDERGAIGPTAWIGSIGRQLEQFERDGLPFAVLLVELLEIERMRCDAAAEELSVLAEHLERALAAELDSSWSSLTSERPGRYWLVLPRTDPMAARELVERLTRALSSRGQERGPALEAAIGLAVCPDDGRAPAALAAHADVGLYAARSTLRVSAGERAARADGP